MNNSSSNTTGTTTTGSMDKKKTAEQSASFAKKDLASEAAPSSRVDPSVSDNAPVKDESKRHAADDAGKSQR